MSSRDLAFFGGGLLRFWHRSAGDSFQLRCESVCAVIGFKLARFVDEFLALRSLVCFSFRLRCHEASVGDVDRLNDLRSLRDLPLYSTYLVNTDRIRAYSQANGAELSMSDELTQGEADELFGLPKKYTKGDYVDWPAPGAKTSVDLVSLDDREAFLLDVSRASIKLERLVLQNRARVTIVLVRLDIAGAGHRNPDDQEIGCPHIHLYREGFHDKWAFPVPPEHFSDLTDHQQTVSDFMRFCKIVQPPKFVEGLF